MPDAPATDDETDILDSDDDAPSSPAATTDEPEYQFDGFKIEFSDKVQLIAPAEKQPNGAQ